MRIVNYSNFINEVVNHDALAQSVEDCLVELGDLGFEVKVAKVRNNFSGICLFITVKKSNDGKFKMKDLKESFDVMIDLLDDGFTYGVKTKFRLVFSSPNYDIEEYGDYYLASSRNTWFDSDIDLFGLEITNIKGKNNIIRSYESVEYSKDKILQEVDELLVELSDIKFEANRNYMVKDGKNILELWIEREVPDFETDAEYDDWYYDKGDIFTIGEVYEPLALLTDWMREKYSADLVDDGMNSDTFTFDGTLNDSNAEVFDPEWKELQRKWFGENYLKKRVSALFVKYVW